MYIYDSSYPRDDQPQLCSLAIMPPNHITSPTYLALSETLEINYMRTCLSQKALPEWLISIWKLVISLPLTSVDSAALGTRFKGQVTFGVSKVAIAF